MSRPQCPFMPTTVTRPHTYIEVQSGTFLGDSYHNIVSHVGTQYGSDNETVGFHECLGFDCAAFIEGRVIESEPIDRCARISNSNLEEL